ncbi:Maf family nucleotide pyrophosphatase [Leeia sp. TBRC 13508]|uniref:7-methyl-GTP pyrophosphatase n=1 Tax=Leeia speluncae TaxID=2884804 RepID=A0ABS8D826_9NEIS|nr:Maf family nucleotide pyrophosphatase [Leeia speluncae]MCB6184366.1 Maf family nucleotide pyrophosphatase [Leeia speluncae]
MTTLVLASTSPYRKELLQRLQLPFVTASPDIDETPLENETAAETANRLAIEKAKAVTDQFPNALIIGSDQVALLNGQQLGKPGTHERAVVQLRAMRGQTMIFHTALALLDSKTGKVWEKVVPYEIKMRDYSDELIETYLQIEKPYNCAGSAKTEGLGTILIEWMRGDDPSAIIGLPLIALTSMLNEAGLPPLGVK